MYEPINLMELNRRIKMLRKKSGLTIEKFAELLNISVSYVGHIERNKIPSIYLLIDICNFFGISLDYLLFGKQENDTTNSVYRNMLNKLDCDQLRFLVRTANIIDLYNLNAKELFFMKGMLEAFIKLHKSLS